MQIYNKSIGIIGGMGPQASVKLYQLLIDRAMTDFGASRNQDYPNIILHSIPIPDFILNKNNLASSLDLLKTHTQQITSNNYSCFGMACNTAHLLEPELRALTPVPFISLPSEVVAHIKKRNYSRIGLLATSATIKSNLYQSKLYQHQIQIIIPNPKQQRIINSIIHKTIAGISVNNQPLIAIADHLAEKQVDAILLGCTELPLLFPKNYKLPIIDTLEILAIALLNRYYSKGDL